MASKGVNKVIIVGNLGQDPEVRYTPNGKAVANISVATSESWKDQSGQMQEKTEWHRIVLWGKTAEVAGEYLRKGSQVYIEGKLQTRKWQDQQGQDRYSTEIVVQGWDDKMQMLGGRTGQSEGGYQQNRPAQQPQQGYQQYPGQQNQSAPQQGGYNQAPAQSQGSAPQNQNSAPQSQPPAPEPDFDFDDDIPF